MVEPTELIKMIGLLSLMKILESLLERPEIRAGLLMTEVHIRVQPGVLELEIIIRLREVWVIIENIMPIQTTAMIVMTMIDMETEVGIELGVKAEDKGHPPQALIRTGNEIIMMRETAIVTMTIDEEDITLTTRMNIEADAIVQVIDLVLRGQGHRAPADADSTNHSFNVLRLMS